MKRPLNLGNDIAVLSARNLEVFDLPKKNWGNTQSRSGVQFSVNCISGYMFMISFKAQPSYVYYIVLRTGLLKLINSRPSMSIQRRSVAWTFLKSPRGTFWSSSYGENVSLFICPTLMPYIA